MDARSSKWIIAGEWLLNKRWWFVLLASLLVLTFEFQEYQPFLRGFDRHFWFEVIFYGVVLPASTGLALTFLSKSRRELAWWIDCLGLQRSLQTRLNGANAQDELAAVLLQFFRFVLPLVGAAFYVYHPRSHSYLDILNWSYYEDGSNSSGSVSQCDFQGCHCSIVDLAGDEAALRSCRDSTVAASSPFSDCFCMPFLLSGSPVGAARFLFPRGIQPSSEQVRLLRSVGPEIASAFVRIQHEELIKRRADIFDSEQQRIARDVHDTLGHSLVYLRLKLDHVLVEYNQFERGALRAEIEALREIAKDAYSQMRDVLVALTPESVTDLVDRLENYADKIRPRASYKVQIRNTGQQRLLPPPVQRHIFFIFQEAMTNIEKHAQARQVDVDLCWQETCLEMTIIDDGAGFDTAQTVQKGHVGLTNMRQRALESSAQLAVSSQVGRGTQITLRVPYEAG